MSYSGYGNPNYRSPYHQQPNAQDIRGQYQDQSRSNGSYQNNAYQPLSAYQSNQNLQASASRGAQSTPYTSQGYESARLQDSRGGYSNGGQSVDTSALGSLAYASSLGRDNGSFMAGFKDARPHINAAGSVQHVTGKRSDNGPTSTSRAAASARTQQASSTPSYGYGSNGYTGYQLQHANAGAQAQGYTQQTTSQASRSSTLGQNTGYMSRPTSDQAIQNSHLRTTSKSSNPPFTQANQAFLSTSRKQTADFNGSEQTRVRSPLEPAYHTSVAVTDTSKRNVQSLQSTFGANSGQSEAQVPPNKASYDQLGPAKSTNQSSTREGQGDETSSRTSTPGSNPYPTTVNPSQVFNHYEFSRRQAAAAEAEAARRKLTTIANDHASDQARFGNYQKTQISQGNGPPSSNNATGSDADAETAKKLQMELEMKQMIEKMRDYKSKDPSLFSQIWEQVKKSQPALRAPSQSAALDTPISPVVVNDQLPSLNTPRSHLLPGSELPPSKSDELDRGRFLAQRGKRGGKNSSPPRKPTASQSGSEPSTSASKSTKPSVQAPQSSTEKNSTAEIHKNYSAQKAVNGLPVSVIGTQSVSQNTTPLTPTPAVMAQKQQPQAAKPGETYWPEDKKRALAEAGREALTTDSKNIGKHITTEEIHELLNQNPSYILMCERLEDRGFVIDRGQFARTLLAAVPHLASSSAPSVAARPPTIGPPPPLAAPQPTQGPLLSPSITYYAPQQPPGMGQTSHVAHAAESASGIQDYRFVNYKSRGPEERRQRMNTVAQSSPRDVNATENLRNSMSKVDTHMVYNVGTKDNRTPPHSIPLTDGKLGVPGTFASNGGSGLQWAERHNFTGASSGEVEVERARNNKMSTYLPTKEDSARKRSFGEIVDLTQLSEEDRPPQRLRLNYDIHVPPAPVPRNGHNSLVTNTGNIAQQQNPNNTATPVSAMGGQSDLKRVQTKPSIRQYLWSQEDIIQPMNKRQNALRRSSYDPKTIARDILVAVGKHPTMAPLNAHLDILRDKFKAVNYDSDLSTFRWDLVDPGDPAVKRGDGNAGDEGSHTPSGQALPSRHRPPIAVIVGAGTGRGSATVPGNMATIPTNDETPRRRRGRLTKGDLASSTVRPESGTPRESVQRREPSSQQKSGQGDPQGIPSQNPQLSREQRKGRLSHGTPPTSTNNQDFSRFMYTDHASTRTPNGVIAVQLPTSDGGSDRTPAGLTPHSGSVLSTPGTDDVPKVRKGRPPGAKNKNPRPDKGILKGKAPQQDPSRNDPSVPTPPSLKMNMTTPIKPSGLRYAMSPTDGIAVVIPSRSPSVVATPPTDSVFWGRLRKMPTSSGRSPSQPSYKIYRCRWEHCPAELHNLQTLEKHVRKHRDKSEAGPFSCKWANCYGSNTSVTNGSQDNMHRERLMFESDTAWQQHVGERHVNEVALELGDGPVTHP